MCIGIQRSLVLYPRSVFTMWSSAKSLKMTASMAGLFHFTRSAGTSHVSSEVTVFSLGTTTTQRVYASIKSRRSPGVQLVATPATPPTVQTADTSNVPSMNSGGDGELGFISHILPPAVNQGEDRVRRFKRICVFCGSRPGFRTTFGRAALLLGNLMVENQIDLVYGGGSVGLMGLISETVHRGGRHVLGVIPRALILPHELLGQTLGEVKIVADMHQRKSEMAKHADAFVALPGGYGTMEELLEMITWSQLGIHDKPVGLLNVEGYYDSLLALLDKGVEEGFIQGSARRILVSADSPWELLSRMEEYEAVHERVATRQRWEVDQLSASAAKSGDTQI